MFFHGKYSEITAFCFGRHESYGKVPSYILKRKEEMLKARQSHEERLKDFPEDCPQGMRLLKVLSKPLKLHISALFST